MPDAVYPVFLRLCGRRVLIVGGGSEAESKIPALTAAGACITVVSPKIKFLNRYPGVTMHQRAFVPADLDNVWYTVTAAPADVNRQVYEAAEARRIFVNAVDDTASATAYLGAVIRRDGITIAMSSQGRAPGLIALLRQAFETLLPHDIATWLDKADELRREWQRHGTSLQERRPLLLRALNNLYELKDGEMKSS